MTTDTTTPDRVLQALDRAFGVDAESDHCARLIRYSGDLYAALEETTRALKQHLQESAQDHNLGNISMLCPCSENELATAEAVLAKVRGEQVPACASMTHGHTNSSPRSHCQHNKQVPA